MKAISLPVLFLNGNDLQLTELGVKSEDECIPEIKEVLFYRIDAISPYNYKGENYSIIHTASQDFICPIEIKKLNKYFDFI